MKRARHAQMDLEQPAYVAFRDLIHELVSLKDRFWVMEGLKALAGDPDGLFVELTDHTPCNYLSPDDCVALDMAYAALLQAREGGAA